MGSSFALPVVGVVGGGQLARMTHQAAIALAVDLRFLTEREEDPAPAVARWSELGSPLSHDDLGRFAESVDLVTFDHEVVDLDALEALERLGVRMFPRPDTLRLVADKAGMRSHLAGHGFPVPPWRAVVDEAGLDAALADLDGPVVVKRSHGGYDGRGVFTVSGPDEARRVAGPLLSGGDTLVVEPFLELEAELAVLVARRPDGVAVTYEPVTTVQVDGMCREVLAPALVPDPVRREASRLGNAIADAVDAVGILAVELFWTGGRLLVNELAARPHNTGHHTIEAAVTSQFENHLRAVLDLPLGDPSPVSPSAMVNVVGGPVEADPRARLGEGLGADAGAHVHLYGKTWRPGRKLGHVTVCDADPERALERARRVVVGLGGGEVTA
ncbi:MAG: 5-(carboxyamino)imidazole ribonucleotide synthase [Acidimicrobiia bacterium]